MSDIFLLPRTIYMKAHYWGYKEYDENGEDPYIDIHIAGTTIEGKSIYAIVQGFNPYAYLKLPDNIVWNSAKIEAVIQYFQKVMKRNGPIDYEIIIKKELYFENQVKCIKLTFPTHSATTKFAGMCHNIRGNIYIENVGVFRAGEFVVSEASFDPIVKYTAIRNINLAGWLKITETIPNDGYGYESYDDFKFSSSDVDVNVAWDDVEPYTPQSIVMTHQTYISFDIECYSSNHNSKIPNATDINNCIISIGCVVGKTHQTHLGLKRYVLVVGNPLEIESSEGEEVTIIRCNDESELLIKFSEFINEVNPDIFITYNGMKFDWDYLIKRSEILGVYRQFSKISKLDGERAELKDMKWESSAYGKQQFKYFEAHGRNNVDVILEVERNQKKLPKYSLEYVSSFYLNKHKDDLTPRQLFMSYQCYIELYDYVMQLNDGLIEQKIRIYIKKTVQRILINRYCSGVIKKIRNKLLNENTKNGIQFKNGIRSLLTLICEYNVQDCILPIELCDFFKIQISMEETANIVNVPMSYLHTRGQGIKVFSQVYREALNNDYIIPFRKRLDKDDYEEYIGALVANAVPGFYRNVACLDFSSLYPSIMIAFNICYTTLLKDDDPTPDSDCNILEWDDHRGCEHDKSGNKVKKEMILCKHHRYRFKKMKMLPDGTRINEGIMPRMERNLLANRKIVKKEMEKKEAMYDMASGFATPDQIEDYKKWGYPIIEKGSLNSDELHKLQMEAAVLNAKQLAIKIAANSGYGILGAQGGMIPLVEGAASITYMGRTLITETNKYLVENIKGDENGKGKVELVYGDTDSTMVYFKNLNVSESFDMAEKVVKDISHHLKCMIIGIDSNVCVTLVENGNIELINIRKFDRKKIKLLNDDDKVIIYTYDALPISLTFENLYGLYLLLSKKRYLAYIFNRKGEKGKFQKKGVVLARRDNSQYLRDSYEAITKSILDGKSKDIVYNMLYDKVHMLFTRQIPDSHLIIYLGVKSVIDYARNKQEIVKANGDTIKVFVDENRNTFDPIGPLDPRLKYSNIPQVLLSLKILRRGEEVPANTRLEYVYVEDEFAEHQGDKAEDYTYYREHRNGLVENGMRPDFLHYIEKQLTNPITELFTVMYPGDIIPYETIENKFERLVRKLNNLQRSRIMECNKISKEICYYQNFADCKEGEIIIDNEENDMYLVGNSVMCNKCRNSKYSGISGDMFTCYNHRFPDLPRVYHYSKFDAKVEYILQSCKKHDQGILNEIDRNTNKELVNTCLEYKSKIIIDNIYSNLGIRKRAVKKPPQAGEKLKVKTNERGWTKVVFLEDYVVDNENISFVPENTYGELRNIKEDINSNPRKKKYLFDIILNDGTEIFDVPRNVFTTFTLRDDKLMKNILLYRKYYKNVVNEVYNIFNPSSARIIEDVIEDDSI